MLCPRLRKSGFFPDILSLSPYPCPNSLRPVIALPQPYLRKKKPNITFTSLSPLLLASLLELILFKSPLSTTLSRHLSTFQALRRAWRDCCITNQVKTNLIVFQIQVFLGQELTAWVGEESNQNLLNLSFLSYML